MSQATSSVSFYKLDPLIRETWQSCENLHPSKRRAIRRLCTLQFAIFHKINLVIEFCLTGYQRDLKALNQRISTKNFTALHIAAIVNDLHTAEMLLMLGASPEIQDVGGWIPYHHAAAAGHRGMMALFKSHGNCSTILTDNGGTAEDLFHLVHAQPRTGEIPVMFQDEQGEVSQLTAEGFYKLTNATYIDEIRATFEQLFADWETPASKMPSPQYLQPLLESYLKSRKNPIAHVIAKVTHNSSKQLLSKSIGWGVRAGQNFEAFAFLGEYVGRRADKLSQVNQEYSIGEEGEGLLDAQELRNVCALANDGDPNAAIIPIYNIAGLLERHILVSLVPIPKGTEIVWNYGVHNVKFRPSGYVELRRQETRDFVKQENIEKLIKLYNSLIHETALHRIAKEETLRYLLCTPSVLFSLVFEGILPVAIAEKLIDKGCHVEETSGLYESLPGLKLIPEIAGRCLTIRSQLAHSSEKQAFFAKYISSLPERCDIQTVLGLANYFSKMLEALLQKNALGDKVWNNDLLPRLVKREEEEERKDSKAAYSELGMNFQ